MVFLKKPFENSRWKTFNGERRPVWIFSPLCRKVFRHAKHQTATPNVRRRIFGRKLTHLLRGIVRKFSWRALVVCNSYRPPVFVVTIFGRCNLYLRVRPRLIFGAVSRRLSRKQRGGGHPFRFRSTFHSFRNFFPANYYSYCFRVTRNLQR